MRIVISKGFIPEKKIKETFKSEEVEIKDNATQQKEINQKKK
jgi:hypothetical protein